MTPTFTNKSKEGINYTSHVCYLKLFYKEWAIWISGKHCKHKYGFIDDGIFASGKIPCRYSTFDSRRRLCGGKVAFENIKVLYDVYKVIADINRFAYPAAEEIEIFSMQ